MENKVEVTKNSHTNEIYDYIRIVRKYIFFTIPVFLFCSLISSWFFLSTVPTYRSSALILVEDKGNQQFLEFGFQSNLEKVNLKNEIQILNSRSLAEAVIDSLLNSKNKNNLHALDTKTSKTLIPSMRIILNNFFINDVNKQYDFQDGISSSQKMPTYQN